MGLTIHYKLSVEKNISSAAVRELIERAALHAKEIGCAEVGEIMRVEPDFPFTSLFVRAGKEEDCCFGDVPARAGWMADVWPGEGCESMLLALCQYPRRVAYQLRDKRGFSAKERELMNGLRRHIELAYRNAERFSQLERASQHPLEQAEEAGAIMGLSRREMEVLMAVLRAPKIAVASLSLGLSPLTVKKHLGTAQ